MGQEFEWDKAKATENLKKHAVPFEYASRVFDDPQRVDREDGRHDYKEDRRTVVGSIDGRLYVVIYTERGAAIRLISARKANVREQKNAVIRFKRDPENPPQLTPEQAERLSAMPIDYSDIPELPDEFWAQPGTKEAVTMRLDREVLAFFRASGGRGYQTRINAVLRAFVKQNRDRLREKA